MAILQVSVGENAEVGTNYEGMVNWSRDKILLALKCIPRVHGSNRKNSLILVKNQKSIKYLLYRL